jgi:hypothetical protein
MTTVVVTHAVGNMDTWLRGGANRQAVFKAFCSSHRIFRHPEANRVSSVCENVDLDKMKATLTRRKLRKRKLQIPSSTRSKSTSRFPGVSERPINWVTRLVCRSTGGCERLGRSPQCHSRCRKV